MANEINNNYKKQPTTNTQKTEDNKNKPLTKEEIAKAAYEGSIFEAAEKIHKTVTKDIPEKILKESQTWGWVKKLQKFFGIKLENEGQKPENK